MTGGTCWPPCGAHGASAPEPAVRPEAEPRGDAVRVPKGGPGSREWLWRGNLLIVRPGRASRGGRRVGMKLRRPDGLDLAAMAILLAVFPPLGWTFGLDGIGTWTGAGGGLLFGLALVATCVLAMLARPPRAPVRSGPTWAGPVARRPPAVPTAGPALDRTRSRSRLSQPTGTWATAAASSGPTRPGIRSRAAAGCPPAANTATRNGLPNAGEAFPAIRTNTGSTSGCGPRAWTSPCAGAGRAPSSSTA